MPVWWTQTSLGCALVGRCGVETSGELDLEELAQSFPGHDWREHSHRRLAAAFLAVSDRDGRLREDESILVGEDLVYVPHSLIGSIGILFVPSSGLLLQLGSYTGPSDFLWAYHYGVDPSRTPGINTLTITTVRDGKQSRRLLRRIFGARWLRAEVFPYFERLPLVLTDVNLYNRIPAVREADSDGSFDFEISA